MAAVQRFHRRTGKLIVLVDERRGAERMHETEEFNDGMVFSENHLQVNELFSVRINKRIASWSGSIEIGLISTDPAEVEIPKGAIAIRHGNWLISGTSVNVDGSVLNDEYCTDLDSLLAGSVIGIMRNEKNEIHLFVNGEDQGVAAICTEEKVWAVVDLYGKCSSVSIAADNVNFSPTNVSSADSISFSERLFQIPSLDNALASSADWQSRHIGFQSYKPKEEPLRFHSKCGSLIHLLDEGKTAVRVNHQDEFNNGVVMTNRTLENDELFEIRINSLFDKWSGSIEMGITTHAPDLLEIPSTMTNLRSGTVMLSGCGIITNGKGTRKEYLEFHLDQLKVGHYIGLMKKSQGTLHYFINGVDQGVAANKIPPHVYGVVDLYGMAVSVSVVPHYCVFERTRRNEAVVERMLLEPEMFLDHSPLLFSASCGKHVDLSGDRKSASRLNPLEDFNHAVVPTERTLQAGETFTIRVEEIVDKWSGSLEIGVTTISPDSLEFPATMTNVRSGTWIMTATGVMCNGVTVVDDYGSNLESLQVGDTLAVCRKANGNLHFYINGVDQGLAASDVPEAVYGVIDLYGQASKASILDVKKETGYPVPSRSSSVTEQRLIGTKFRSEHGKNCVLIEGSNSAFRKNPQCFYDNAVVMGSAYLVPGDLYEVEVDKIIPHWNGSLELGLTSSDKVSTFPASLVELKTETWVWTGSTTLENGAILNNNLSHDTERLTEKSRIGLMLVEDWTVRGYFDGLDVGVLFRNVKDRVYPILNLYGKCAQVTILDSPKTLSDKMKNFSLSPKNVIHMEPYTVLKNRHRFYHACDRSVTLVNDHKAATRSEGPQQILLFSANPIEPGELFEILITDCKSQYKGSMAIGIVSSKNVNIKTLASVIGSIEDVKTQPSSCVVTGGGVYQSENLIKQAYCPTLRTIEKGDRVGISVSEDETLQIHLNGKNLGRAASGFSLMDPFHVVVCMGPRVLGVEILDNAANLKEVKGPPSLSDSSSEEGICIKSVECNAAISQDIYALSKNICGKNVRITDDGLTATRVGSYNQAIVVTSEPLTGNSMFQVKVKSLDEKWKSCLSVGVTAQVQSELKLPVDSLKMSKLTWMIHQDAVFKNGMKILQAYGPGLNAMQVSQVVGLLIDRERNLHMYIDGIDQGVAAKDMPERCYGVVDLYGSCDEIEVTKESSMKHGEEYEKEDSDILKANCLVHNPRNVRKECTLSPICRKFIQSLAIPDLFFSGNVSCFCASCFEGRGEAAYRCQGDPPLKYAQPLGWCKFSLRIHPNVDIVMVSKHWNVAFHGAKVGAVRKYLDMGEVVIDTSPVLDLRNSTREDEDILTRKRVPVVLSPAVNYIANENLCPKVKFHDPKTDETYAVQLAFQLFIQPSTFKTKVPTSSERWQGIDMEPVEWTTKQQGTTILSHILVKPHL